MPAVANFVKRDDRYKTEKPYLYHGPAQEGFPQTNLIYEEAPLSLTDLRTVPDFQPTIESHGFCFIENVSKELPALIDESNSQPYAVEMAGVLRKLLNARLVLPVQTRVCLLCSSLCFSDAFCGTRYHCLFSWKSNTVIVYSLTQGMEL